MRERNWLAAAALAAMVSLPVGDAPIRPDDDGRTPPGADHLWSKLVVIGGGEQQTVLIPF